ncbi:MAG: hypothetical protein ACJAW4_001952 [Paracoccaceae bacterium]|jgi:hypothetical protein
MIAATIRHAAFPVVTIASTPLSITWMRDWGMTDMWGALILAGFAGFYLFSAKTAMPYDEADVMTRWMPSGISMAICAGLLALFAAALLAGAI